MHCSGRSCDCHHSSGVHGLLGEEENRWLDNTLAANPTAGVVMRGTGGVRKLRIALEGRGKSGGARVIYYYLGRKERIFLVSVYAKNEADNVSAAELRQMRKLTAVLEAEP
jgi:mRNA-degrading endonuclease RelE of RelBE toxin-antitoxin system